MGPFDSRAIANRILDIASERGLRLTMMQLLKLVYIAHGWWLTYSNGRPLTTDKPQAWQYGPVHPLVYRAFRQFGAQPISGRAYDPETGFAYSANVSSDVDSVLESVVQSYGPLHAYRLSDMTHQPGTPWDRATKTWGNYAPISDMSIKEHFDELRRQRT
jgi:uncharacterized phage-associated protein